MSYTPFSSNSIFLSEQPQNKHQELWDFRMLDCLTSEALSGLLALVSFLSEMSRVFHWWLWIVLSHAMWLRKIQQWQEKPRSCYKSTAWPWWKLCEFRMKMGNCTIIHSSAWVPRSHIFWELSSSSGDVKFKVTVEQIKFIKYLDFKGISICCVVWEEVCWIMLVLVNLLIQKLYNYKKLSQLIIKCKHIFIKKWNFLPFHCPSPSDYKRRKKKCSKWLAVRTKVKVCVLSCVDSASPWTVARQAPLSMKFSRKEYWSQLPFPHPGSLPDPEDQTHASSCIFWTARQILYWCTTWEAL